ncbi:MAG: redoxin domain-containing protein [Bacteroidetes bacterium]|uniref:Redoxin domain-containing protein n=1 Tax=Candidatus Egerieousia excrementavium TaxID=2840778 RepID=A0A9D9DMS4_9BACT|nr:redoxin domain-containing protein [Candidatus Egerieousia excrementavium]
MIKSFLTLLLVVISCSAYSRTGYRIAVNAGGGSGMAILQLLQWDRKTDMDSVMADNGVFLFKGKQSLLPGEYSVSYNGETFEFFVSQTGYVSEKFRISSGRLFHERGSEENRCFAEFQNFLKDGWKSLSSAGQMQRIIDSLYLKVSETASGSLLESFLKMSSSYSDIYALVSDGRMRYSRFARSYIVEYLENVEMNSCNVAIAKVDSLIAMSAENLRSLVAEEAFDLFYNSKIMGHEGVACHIAENYFLNGEIKLEDRDKLFLIKSFVMFNASSLVGKRAAELSLEDTSGRIVSLQETIHGGEFTILYFYTDDCANCIAQTPGIMDVIDNYDRGVLSFYSVYTGTDSSRWKSYVGKHFFSYNPFVNWANVWDPDAGSSYHLLYGVVSTPKLFLIDRHGVIVGRNLDAGSLRQLLDNFSAERDELHRLFDRCFAGGQTDRLFVERTIDTVCGRIFSNGDLYIRVADELYLYLASADSYAMQQGSVYLAEKYIIARASLWNDEHYIMQLKEAVRAFNMNRPGERAANLHLVNEGGASVSLWDIGGKYKLLYFFKPDCGVCNETTALLKDLEKRYADALDCRIIAVNTARDRDRWIKYIIENDLDWINLWDDTKSSVIFENYFLKEVPQIYLLDADNVVLAKNVTPQDLEYLFEMLENRETEQ